MKIVKIHGGLANQMFQYCFYLILERKYGNVYVDIDTFKPVWGFDVTVITDVFSNVKLKPKKVSFWYTQLNRYLKRLSIPLTGYVYERSMKYSDEYLTLKNAKYFDGYWQSELYFEKFSEEIRKIFEFNNDFDEHVGELLSEISNVSAISIHVRKGKDYLQNPLTNESCDIEYFQRAVNYINSFVPYPIFYIFSDNFDWVDANFSFLTYKKVNFMFDTANDFRDMQLMSACKHNIISNSTFSWWAAWLNKNKGKMVVAPRKWFNSNSEKYDSSTILPANWIKL